ncbi:MAG TPA: PIG-L family deacetylase, partial [Flavisolibacter sp.]
SRSQHKSQGFGASSSRGEAFEYFKLTGGTEPRENLFDDVRTDWSRVKGGEKIEKMINQIIEGFDFIQPQKSVPALTRLYRELENMPMGYWRNRKLKEVQDLVESASGLFIESFTTTPHAVQEDSVRLNFVVNSRLGAHTTLRAITGVDEQFPSSNFSIGRDSLLPANRNFVSNITVAVKNKITQPYWLEEKMSPGYFNVNRQENIGEPDIQPGLEVLFKIKIEGQDFVFRKPVKYKFTHPVKGEVYQPLTVIPPANVLTSPEVLLFRKNQPAHEPVMVQMNANKKIMAKSGEGHIRSSNYDQTKQEGAFTLNKSESKTYHFNLNSADMKNDQTDQLYGFVHYVNDGSDHSAYLAMRTISYDHIPTLNYFYADGVSILHMDLKTHGKKVGYIIGAGDKVPEALEQMGYEVTLLTDKELERNNLQQFDAIISGVRAYNTNEWLNKYHDKLMKYVEEGGNLIVQYNTSNNIGPVRARIGPYPFNISRGRITDETAEVRFLQPGHQVLNFPNKITQKDFEGWVQERSIYHAAGYDTSFQAIFSINDPGENADNGSLVISKYGKGYFTYTGLVFFRQLPAAVPGAYRLLANLIALNRKKE